MPSQMFEVEQKFPVADFSALVKRLDEHGTAWDPAIDQVDTYYSHPIRDFRVTDEALRIRRVGEQGWVTYKGPKLDQRTKTRHEIEVALAAGTRPAEDLGQVLECLGFAVVAQVRKTRRPGHLQWQDRPVEVALDEVPEVGRFMELEICVPAAELDAARDAIELLARDLRLGACERRSYLELLLEARGESR